jgi:hypothetical protein
MMTSTPINLRFRVGVIIFYPFVFDELLAVEGGCVCQSRVQMRPKAVSLC